MIRLLAGLFSFLALGAIAAVAGVALIFWLYDRDLPSHESLASYEPATLSRVYSGEGRLIAEYARERRIFTPYEEIPDIVKAAFISAEDKNFYNHPGIDATGVARAVLVNIRSLRAGQGGLQGGSTITQQVVKNFLLTSDRSIERKIKEAILTLRIERALPKDRILELYLNEIFLGQNAYGVAAAAQRYFGKTLEDLTYAEAAYLAALPQAPSALHPVRQRDRAEARRNYVLREMFQNGVISEIDMLTAQSEPLRTLFDGGVETEIASAERPNYFTEEIRRQLTQRLGSEELLGGGLTIRATIDPDLQRAAEEALRKQLLAYDREQGGYGGPVARIDGVNLDDAGARRAAMASTALPRDIPGWRPALVIALTDAGATVAVEGGEDTAELSFADVRSWTRRRGPNGELGGAPQGPGDVWQPGDVVMVEQADGKLVMRQIPEVQGAFMAMEIETGRVLAMQGGFSYDSSVFNRATQAQRQPGSAFKPFIYAAALEQGYSPASVILDAPVVLRAGGNTWRPQNSSGRFYGPSPMRIGLELSRNLMTVRLAQAVGMDTVAGYAERFGVYEQMPEHLSYALGAGETTLTKMVAAYAMFANGGQLIAPTLVDRIQDRRGETVWRHDARICVGCALGYDANAPAPEPLPTGEQVMDPVTAYQITSMLRGAVTRGTASRPFSGVQAVVAGKTGTTNDARDVWFVGYSPTIAFGCYIGFDTPRPLGRGAFGGTLCAPMVAEFVRAAHAERPWGDFEVPRGVEFINVDRWTGRPGGGETIAEVFRAGQGPGDTAMIIGGDGDFYFDGSDFPMSLDDAAPVADAGTGVVGQGGAGQGGAGQGGASRPAPAIGGGFAAPGGLY